MSRLEKARARLRERYAHGLTAKAEAFRAALNALAGGDLDALEGIRRLAHQLRGSAGSFGYSELGAIAHRVETASEEDVAAELTLLIRTLEAAITETQDPERILLIEDDSELAALLGEELRSEGREVAIAGTLSVARRMLDRRPPDAVILDLVLPDGDGRELLAAMQADARTAGIPLIVLSARGSTQIRTECLALGADAYFIKPVDATLLVTATSAILGKRRSNLHASRHDPLTGLANRAGLYEAFARAQSLSDRANLPLSLAIVDVDHFKRFNDDHGHVVGDRALIHTANVLDQATRKSDIVGRWGGEEFVLLLPNTNVDGALIALQNVQQALKAQPLRLDDGEIPAVTLSGGLVEVGGHEGIEDAVLRADHLLYRAKAAGRNRFLNAEPSAGTGCPQILYVEDDPDASALVTSLLRGSGMEVTHAADMATALMACDDRAYDAVILDKDLPDGDGFAVLRDLRARPAGRSVPVLMLTAVGEEEEIERAFAAGADDYVQKPFRERELVARLRRLLR